MADETTLGKLVVRLLLDDENFKENAKKSSSELDKLASKFQGLANTLNKAVIGAIAGAAASMAAFAAASAVTGAEFEDAITKTAAVSNDGITSIGALTEKARELGATTAYSATEAATAMLDLAQAGLRTEEIMAGAEAGLLLAGSTGSELAQATGLMAATMSQFDLAASETTRISDVFSMAMRTTLFDMSSLTEAMKYAGTVGKSYNYTLEETTAAVGLFRNLGLEGSMAGTNFRMAMASLVSPTEEAKAAIKAMGLSLDEVNPALNDFSTIMERFGKAGLDSASAAAIFSVRTAGNMQAIAQSFADGSTEFYTILDSLNNAAGTTQEVYAQMMDTVGGQWQILVSSVEELMLAAYDSFAAPMKTVLTALGETVAFVASDFQKAAGDIRDGIQRTADDFNKWLAENKEELAAAFRSVADIMAKVVSYGPTLIQNFDKIAYSLAAIYAVVQTVNLVIMVGQLVMAVQALLPVLAAAQAQVTALIAEIAAGTGGMYLAVVAIGAVVTALVGLAIAYTDAERAARALEVAQAAGKERAAEVTAYWAEATADAVETSKLLEEQTRASLAAEGDLTAVREQELNLIRDLSEEEIAGAVARGEALVTLDGQIRTVAGLYEELGEKSLPTVTAAIEQHTEKAAELEAEYQRVADAIEHVRFMEEQLGSGAGATAARHRLEAWGGTIEAAEAYQKSLTELAGKETAAAKKLGSSLADERAKVAKEEAREREAKAREEARRREEKLAKERQAAMQAAEDAKKAREKEAEDARKAQEKASADLAALREEVFAETARIGLDEAALRQKAYEDEVARAQDLAFEKMVAFEGNAEMQEEIQRDLDEILTRMAENHAAKELAIAQKAAADKAKATLQAQEAAQADLESMTFAHEERMIAFAAEAADTRREKVAIVERQLSLDLRKLEAERAAFMKNNAEMTAEQRAQAEAYYLGERERLEAQSARDIEQIHDETDSRFVAGMKKAVSAAATAGKAMADAFSAVGDAISSVVSGAYGAYGIFTDITGFGFNLIDLVGELVSLRDEAEEGGALFDAESAAKTLVDGIVDGAIGMLEMLVEAAPLLISSLAERLPDLIGKLVEAIPLIIAGIVEALPDLIAALVEGIPLIVEALVAQLPVLIDFLAGAIPDLIGVVLEQVPIIVTAIMDALPSIADLLADAIVQIVESLPDIVGQILAAIPDVITGILAAIPQIISAVFDAIPKIIAEVIKFLPDIIMALIEGVLAIVVHIAEELPYLIASIIELIPDLILAIIGMIPDLITAIIAAIPDIIFGLIDGLPTLIKAIIMAIPEIIIGLIAALPEIIVALVQGLVVEVIANLPDIIIALVTGIIEGLWEGIVGLVEMIGEAFKDLFSVGKDKSSSDSGGEKDGGWLSDAWDTVTGWFAGGLDYVPAPMRVTVHPGEAIVPADQNRAGGRIGGGINPPAPFMPSAGPGAAGGGFRAEVVMVANGRELDRALVESMDAGNAPRISSKMAKASGVVTGYNRGRLNRWGG